MIAAIYARKSTEQNGVGDDEKSVTRQIDHARLYAAKKGWSVADEHIYSDDGISGAEFVKRPAFLRLMNALKPRPVFQVLIMSEESRLGREQIETAYALKQITDAGVRVFFYLGDRERTLDSAMDKVMLSLTNFAAEMERERARQRTYDAMARKARALHVTGGKVFGYDNVEVQSPDGQRLHVVRRINSEQADVVRRIFQLYADGLGLTKLAKRLNAERVPPPRQDNHGWAGTAIREMLRRELYRGVVVWNRSEKIVKGGTKKQRTRPETEWLKLEAPELRIVSEELWEAVEKRRQQAATTFPRRRSGGKLLGRPAGIDGESPYLLTGFAVCAVCNRAIGGSTQLHGNGPASGRRRVTFYHCVTRRKRGDCICSNDVVLRQPLVDDVVLDAVSATLGAPVVDTAIGKAIARLQAGEGDQIARRATVEREIAVVQARLGRLLEALIGGGSGLETLVAQMKAEEERKKALEAELEALSDLQRVSALDPDAIRRDLEERVRDVKALLGRHTAQARQMLRKLLDGKIVAEPVVDGDRKGYRLSGQLNVGRLLQREVFAALEAANKPSDLNSRMVVAPTGFEPVFQP